jgi:hypothetical protein
MAQRPAPAPGAKAKPGVLAFQPLHDVPEIADYIESLFVVTDLDRYHSFYYLSFRF